MATKWKNKLLASFLKSKKVRHNSSPRTPQQPRAKWLKATFSQLSDPVDNIADQQADIIQDSDSESEAQNTWTNFDRYGEN